MRPTAAFVYSVIGGTIILLWGVAIIVAGLQAVGASFGWGGGTALDIGILEAALGALVILFGMLLYVRPLSHARFGTLVVVFSLASLIGLGGLLLGFLLGLIGGIRGMTHDPIPDTSPSA